MKIRMVRKTDQWNNEDFAGGPRVFTISHVTEGKEQAPYDIHFTDGESKCWRPSNGMLEVLFLIWGDETKTWAGHQVELYRDASVKIGRDVVGGIRVRSISHIDKPMSPVITVSRGTRKPYTVQPLATVAAPVLAPELLAEWVEALSNSASIEQLQLNWAAAGKAGVTSHPAIIAAKDAAKRALA